MDLGNLRLLLAPDPHSPAIRPEWAPMAKLSWDPPDGQDWSARISVTAYTDEGTTGQIRARVVSSGLSTPTVTISSGTALDRISGFVRLGVGSQMLIVEGRITSGAGKMRVTNVGNGVVLSSLADTSDVPAEGTAAFVGGAATLTAVGTFAAPATGVPGTPLNFTGVAGDGQITYTFTAPTTGGEVEGYVLEWEVDGEAVAEPELLWSTSSDYSAAVALEGAALPAGTSWITASIPPTVYYPNAPLRVEWFVDDALVRDNDIQAPYELRAAGFYFASGPHTVTARIVYAETVQPVILTASFTVTPAGSFAGPGTVGHLVNGTSITSFSGDYTATAGGSLDSRDITGELVGASGFVGTNLRVRKVVRSSAGLSEPIQLSYSSLGPRSYTEVQALTDEQLQRNVFGAKYIISRSDIAGCVDNLFPQGSDVVIYDSWLHGCFHRAVDPYQAGGDSHCDACQVWNGSNITLARNRIDAFQWNATDAYDAFNPGGTWPYAAGTYTQTGLTRQTSALLIGCGGNGGNGPTSNVKIEGNRIAGYVGGHLIQVGQANHTAVPTGVSIVGNMIDTRGILSTRKVLGLDPRVTVTWTDNVDHTGAALSLAKATTLVGSW